MNDDHNIAGAMSALQRGNAARALDHLAAVESPSLEAWFLRAQAFRIDNRENEAEQAARAGLSIDAQDLELRLLLADILADGRPQEAEALYLAVLSDFPTDNKALMGYAWLLATHSDPDGAASVMARVPAHIGASDPFALSIQGVIALSNGKIAESRELLDRGLASDPNNVFLHYLQASHESISGGRTSHMVTHLGSAAASNPRLAGELGYEARYLNHPLMRPNRLASRIGPGKLWIAWIVFILGFRQIWPDGPFGWVVLGYLTFAVYTWIAPPLLRKWLKRKGEL